MAAAHDVRAQTCAEEIALLAQQYGLSMNLPMTPQRPGQSSGSLGVPSDVRPQVLPYPDARQAALRAQMQSLLDAALAERQDGNEAACLDRVARARSLPEPG